jgi:hypothetical protein
MNFMRYSVPWCTARFDAGVDTDWIVLFCRARRALINRPNGIGPVISGRLPAFGAMPKRRRNKKSPANFAGPFPVLKPVPD